MATYYVSLAGSNSAAGAIGSPWQTIAHGLGHLSAGDALLVRGGTYTGQLVRLTHFGNVAGLYHPGILGAVPAARCRFMR